MANNFYPVNSEDYINNDAGDLPSCEDIFNREDVQKCFKKIYLIYKSELVQGFLNLVVFLSAMFVFTNNILEINYKAGGFQYFEENLYLLAVLYQSVCALVVMLHTIRTPFTENQKYDPVNHSVALLVACQSFVVEDPQLLFSTLETISENTVLTPGGETVNFTVSTEISSEKQDIGSLFISFIGIGKLILLLAGIIAVLKIYYVLDYYDFRQIMENKLDFIYNQWYAFILFLFTVFSFSFRFALTEEKIETNFDMLRKNNADFIDYLESSGINTIYYLVASLFALLSTFIFIFTKPKSNGKADSKEEMQQREPNMKINHGYLLLFFTNLQNLIQYDTFLYDGPMFNFTYVLIVLTFFASVTTFHLEKNQIDPRNVCFKLGLILSVLSLSFLFVAYTNDWFDVESDSELTDELAAKLEFELDYLSANINATIDELFSLAAKIQPCVRENYLNEQFNNQDDAAYVNGPPAIYTDPEVVEGNRQERQRIFEDTLNYYNPCIPSPNPNNEYPINTSYSAQCVELENVQETAVTEQSTVTDAADDNLNQPFINTDEEQDRYVVDSFCVNLQCDAVLLIAIYASGLSFVPFMGVVAWLIQLASRIAYQVFQIGRMIFRMVKPMKRKKRLIFNLARKIKKLFKIFKSLFKFTLQQLIVFFPQFVAFSIAVALILYRRDRLIDDDVARKIAIGVFLPLFLAFFLISIFVFLTPPALQALLDLLPKAVITAQIFQKTGYQALKYSYMFGAVGQLLLIIACFFEYLEKKYKNSKFVKFFTSNNGNDPDKKFKESLEKIEVAIEPTIFSLPGFVFCLLAIFVNYYPYVELNIQTLPEASQTIEEIAEVQLDDDRSAGMSFEIQDGLCGLVGEGVKAIIKAIVDAADEAVTSFNEVAAEAVLSLQEAFGDLTDPDLLTTLYLPVPEGVVISNVFCFIIPFVCSAFLVVGCFVNYIWPNTQEYTTKIALVILFAALSNALGHLIYSSTLASVNDFDLPFISAKIRMGSGFYITIASSFGNVVSSLVIYLNSILPLNKSLQSKSNF